MLWIVHLDFRCTAEQRRLAVLHHRQAPDHSPLIEADDHGCPKVYVLPAGGCFAALPCPAPRVFRELTAPYRQGTPPRITDSAMGRAPRSAPRCRSCIVCFR